MNTIFVESNAGSGSDYVSGDSTYGGARGWLSENVFGVDSIANAHRRFELDERSTYLDMTVAQTNASLAAQQLATETNAEIALMGAQDRSDANAAHLYSRDTERRMASTLRDGMDILNEQLRNGEISTQEYGGLMTTLMNSHRSGDQLQKNFNASNVNGMTSNSSVTTSAQDSAVNSMGMNALLQGQGLQFAGIGGGTAGYTQGVNYSQGINFNQGIGIDYNINANNGHGGNLNPYLAGIMSAGLSPSSPMMLSGLGGGGMAPEMTPEPMMGASGGMAPEMTPEPMMDVGMGGTEMMI